MRSEDNSLEITYKKESHRGDRTVIGYKSGTHIQEGHTHTPRHITHHISIRDNTIMVVVPDRITGSAGSRVRLIFGDNGNEWLLLLNHDNGDTKWQVKDWKGIPGAVAKQINNCTAKGRDVKEVDFGPDGAWFVNGKKPDGSMSHSWWGGTVALDDIKSHHKVSFGTCLDGCEASVLIDGRNGYECKNVHNDVVERLKRINGKNKEIHFVRLFHHNRYIISDEEGMEWRLNNDHCDTEIRKPGKIEEVAMAGDGSWVIIRENKFVSSMGVDRDLEQKLSKFFSDQHRWANARRQDIRNARERLAREQEEEERQRFAQEQAERAAEQMRVAAENEARAAAEAAERERAQLQAREADRAAQERIERDAATRISSLEAKLEKRFLDEAEDIKDMEEKSCKGVNVPCWMKCHPKFDLVVALVMMIKQQILQLPTITLVWSVMMKRL